jgi:hypothetical protein
VCASETLWWPCHRGPKRRRSRDPTAPEGAALCQVSRCAGLGRARLELEFDQQHAGGSRSVVRPPPHRQVLKLQESERLVEDQLEIPRPAPLEIAGRVEGCPFAKVWAAIHVQKAPLSKGQPIRLHQARAGLGGGGTPIQWPPGPHRLRGAPKRSGPRRRSGPHGRSRIRSRARPDSRTEGPVLPRRPPESGERLRWRLTGIRHASSTGRPSSGGGRAAAARRRTGEEDGKSRPRAGLESDEEPPPRRAGGGDATPQAPASARAPESKRLHSFVGSHQGIPPRARSVRKGALLIHFGATVIKRTGGRAGAAATVKGGLSNPTREAF